MRTDAQGEALGIEVFGEGYDELAARIAAQVLEGLGIERRLLREVTPHPGLEVIDGTLREEQRAAANRKARLDELIAGRPHAPLVGAQPRQPFRTGRRSEAALLKLGVHRLRTE